MFKIPGKITRIASKITIFPSPYAPCMEYLPTFALKITQMHLNIPYMEHLGYEIS
jgi:hypothetical protein